jgi:hypothetical protein
MDPICVELESTEIASVDIDRLNTPPDSAQIAQSPETQMSDGWLRFWARVKGDPPFFATCFTVPSPALVQNTVPVTAMPAGFA